MKSDARLILNKKKWKNSAGGHIEPSWRNRDLKTRGGTVDARKILNLKRNQKSKAPVLGSYMRARTASDLIVSQIKKEILPKNKVPEKLVSLSRDGNLIITSKSKKSPQMMVPRKDLSSFKIPPVKSSQVSPKASMQWESSSDTDDLEHTALEDLIDIDALPSSYVSPKVAQSTNLSHRSSLQNILDMKNTMVADQLTESSTDPIGAKIYVSNLHPSVSLTDTMELFGDVGVITNVEMLRPGTAIIHFYDEEDAKKACELYHNRLLDGQPMKCHMQVDYQSQKTSISQRLGNRFVAPPEPKPVAKSVVANPMSRYNPRNVQFIVKLT